MEIFKYKRIIFFFFFIAGIIANFNLYLFILIENT